MQDVLGEGLSVIANTADDIEIAGVDVSPDPDLITYWLSGEIDEERGWGIRGDSFTVFDRLVQLGTPDWFRLSDRDLAACLYRRVFISEGGTRTAAQAQIARALGVEAAVLPMCEEPVRTRVRTADGWRGLQQYLVAEHAEAQIEAVEIDGIADATPTKEVLRAIGGADAIVIGPSNPVISIGPILAMPALREAIGASTAPVVAVSPFVAGQVVKGPTDIFMQAVGRPSTAAGVASLYQGLIGGMRLRLGRSRPTPRGDRGPDLPDADGGPCGPTPAGRANPRVQLEPEPGMNKTRWVRVDTAQIPVASLAVGAAPDNLHTTAIIPVKGLTDANRRLDQVLFPKERTRLAEALFLDLIMKLPRSRCVDDILVVTADESVARQARWFGHMVLKQEEDEGHSESASAGARAAMVEGAERVAMLPVDCPLLEIEELDAKIGRSPRTALIVPDRHGTGTNALVLVPPDVFVPAFGPDSCARHVSRARGAGISFALEEIESMGLDLDTPEDMSLLRDRLLLDPQPAPRTAEVLWELGDRAQRAAA